MVSKTEKLPNLVAQFLNYLVFSRSYAILTRQSYMLDLSQAFELKQWGQLELRTLEDGVEKVYWVPKEGSPPVDILSEGQIDASIQGAVRRWSPLSAASRNRKIASLRSFLKWLTDEQYIESDRTGRLECTKVHRKLPHYLSADEAIALITHLSKQASLNPVEAQKYLLTLLLYGGGLRVSEACSLQWRKVRLDDGSIFVQGKGGKERLITLPPMVRQALLRSPDRNEAYVWGKAPLCTRKAYQWVRQSGAAAGLLSPLNPHALRHSFATHILASGANLRILQELLGHTSLAATERYTHVDIDQLGRTLNRHHPLQKVKLGN